MWGCAHDDVPQRASVPTISTRFPHSDSRRESSHDEGREHLHYRDDVPEYPLHLYDDLTGKAESPTALANLNAKEEEAMMEALAVSLWEMQRAKARVSPLLVLLSSLLTFERRYRKTEKLPSCAEHWRSRLRSLDRRNRSIRRCKNNENCRRRSSNLVDKLSSNRNDTPHHIVIGPCQLRQLTRRRRSRVRRSVSQNRSGACSRGMRKGDCMRRRGVMGGYRLERGDQSRRRRSSRGSWRERSRFRSRRIRRDSP